MRYRLIFPVLVVFVLTSTDAELSQSFAGDRSDCQSANPDRAIRGCTRLLKRKRLGKRNRSIVYQNLAASYHNRGVGRVKKRKYKKAIADFSQAIKLFPKEYAYYSKRGNAYSKSGRHEEALADYGQAIRLHKKSFSLYYKRGMIYVLNGMHEEAILDLTQAIRLNGQNSSVYVTRGDSYKKLKKYQKAVADYSHAIKLKPKDAKYYAKRILVYIELKQYTEAKADCEGVRSTNAKYVAVCKLLQVLIDRQ